MARRRLFVIAAAAALLGAAIYLNTPPALVNAALAPELPDDIEAWLADRERQVASQFALIPETEKRVTWYGEPGERTAWVVVSLHGFSATRQETAPLAERVATALAANLFETRLSGHGRAQQIPGRDLGDAELAHQFLCLGPFPRTRRTKQNNSHLDPLCSLQKEPAATIN